MVSTTNVTPNLRENIDAALANGAWTTARAQLIEYWSRDPGPATAGYVLNCFEKLRPHFSFTPCRLFVLRSFTVEPVVPLARAAAAIAGVDLKVEIGGFNTYQQELLADDSALYAFRPDIVVLALQTRDVAADLWEQFTELSTGAIASAIERVAGDFISRIKTVRQKSASNLVVHGLELPAWPAGGLWDYRNPSSQAEAIRKINRRIQDACRECEGVYFLDYDALVARVGREPWHDERKWLTMRMPIAASALFHLADEWLRFICPLMGRTCKAIVTDLDNTLWGGVVGEDGFNGIQIGREYPGAAYREVQRALLDCHRRGILLAVCSKNNPADAMEALEKHPEMLLRPEHFSAMRINWTDKVQNLREMAAELNIGIDSLAFLDDNPAERQRIQMELPEVSVLELPDNPMAFASVIRRHPSLERLTLSSEDRERARYYRDQRERVSLQESASSLEEFLRSLSQTMRIEPVNDATRRRVAQLTQKTNQFNLTTHRYSEQQISDISGEPGSEVYSVQVQDRFGDNGIVGVIILRKAEANCEIDTFLLSCRVLGRTLETAMLAFILDRARKRKS
ncbi:MAG TPA: HAD-IIIC family phosphatase, partial [Candidatus Binataceae bacterium]|nr:HAD-IIIC family phosphatase [Candidatus Binataceae bacterium]